MTIQVLTEEMLQNPTVAPVGQRVIVEGSLVVKGDHARVEIQNFHVEIDDLNFLDRLLDAVPCYLGGDHLYRDPVSLVGVLKIKGQDAAISQVESGVLRRDGEEFAFS